MRVERTFRGISVRIAVHYLENLGGELLDSEGDLATPAGAATVEGDGWRAELSCSTVDVGPSLTLKETSVTFDGDRAVLSDLVPAFEQKAMRAGG